MQAMAWTQGVTVRVLGIGLLALLMLIPLVQVQMLITERRGLEFEARAKIAERWGGEQTIGGPVLVIPVRKQVQNEKGWVSFDVQHVVLSDQLTINGSLETEKRSYGIYETPVYTSTLNINGRINLAAVSAMLAPHGEPLWQSAVLRMPIADVRGIRSMSALRIDGRELDFGPAGGDIGALAATEVALPLDASMLARTLDFDFDVRLAGTASLNVLPLSRQTDVSLQAKWPDPGFAGAFLPASREVDAEGFRAQWQVLDLNRAYGQQWREASNEVPNLQGSAFGVELYQPVGTYQRNERAGKYGILFVALTFIALFLFDALGRWRVHPVQYLLVGLALCTFYVVLLALSEQVGFAWAYVLASIAVVSIISGYAFAASRSRGAGAALGALLGFIYALLYGLVVSEQYSLLIGAIALLVSVGTLMYLTRRVDWYALGPARVKVPGRMQSA